MDNKKDLFTETVQLICSGFEDQKDALSGENDLASFYQALTQVVRMMLYKDYNRLINILYRMDVDEKKYLKLFKELPSDKIAEGLADLIIERARQKAEMRRRYR
jgi:hypothetical protein